jgi:hypothetical protein
VIFEVESARMDGERVRAEMLGAAAADWLLIGPEGTGSLDIRATLCSRAPVRSTRIGGSAPLLRSRSRLGDDVATLALREPRQVD